MPETGPDLSEFEAAQTRVGGTCSIKTLLALLDDEHRAKLEAAMASTYQHSAVARVLKKWGHNMHSDAISRHRRGQCACEPD